MYILKETQEFVDHYVGVGEERQYYGGHHPEYEDGNLEGVIYELHPSSAFKFPTKQQVIDTITTHGMEGQFEIVEV